jgi:hypothetical protein
VQTIFWIGGTSYSASQRAGARLLPNELTRVLEGGYDHLAFHETSLSPSPTWRCSQAVRLEVDGVTAFSGEVVEHESQFGGMAWTHGYTCLGLKYQADRVPITAVDGTGTQIYNRTPEDPYYILTDAGLPLGEMFRRVLSMPATAAALSAIGVGGYTTLSPPTLHPDTLADLALITVVPPSPIIFQGEAIFNQLDQHLQQWSPKFLGEVTPLGLIRFRNTTDLTVFVPRTITLPGPSGPADPALPPRVRRSTQNCATRLVQRGGPEVESAQLSEVDGTLARVFTPADEADWTLYEFTKPNGCSDHGTVVSNTSSSATLRSSDPGVFWTTNFWPSRLGTLTLIDSLATGISQVETRIVTSNDALSPGLTSTLSWDATWPVTGATFDTYRIIGAAGGLNDCWRTYAPREPATGKTALDTWIGSHLVVRSAKEIKVGNASKSFGEYYTTAQVVGPLGQSMPLGLQPVPSRGIFRFYQPVVTVYGATSLLNTRSPATVAEGLPADVQVWAIYSRGPLSVTVPADVAGVPQYEGTAATVDGLRVTKYLDYPNWLWKNDTAGFGQLAREYLDTMRDAEVDVDLDWIDTDGTLPGWDYLSFTWALNVAINGAASPWSAVNAPVRSVRVAWDWTGEKGVKHLLSFHASTRRRPFSGADLYVHPQFATGSPLANETRGAAGNLDAYEAFVASGMARQAAGGTSVGDFGRFAAGDMGSMGQDASRFGPGNMAGLGPQAAESPFGASDVLMAGMDMGAGVQDRDSQIAQEHHEAVGGRRDDARQEAAGHRAQLREVERRDRAERKEAAKFEPKEQGLADIYKEEAGFDKSKDPAEFGGPDPWDKSKDPPEFGGGGGEGG